MAFGSQTDIDTARAMVDLCPRSRANFCDTANVYSGGRSEEVLGEVLGDRRRGIEASSRRLGTDYLDIHYLHLPTMTWPWKRVSPRSRNCGSRD